jgi:hypothetical protein
MSFTAFLIRLIIALIVAAGMHYGFKLYIRDDRLSLAAKVIWAYLGAWAGPPVFGYWFPALAFGQVAILPSILGAIAILILLVDYARTMGARSV